jgi:hypothetical protein
MNVLVLTNYTLYLSVLLVAFHKILGCATDEASKIDR